MKTFLKSINEQVWLNIAIGWKLPVMIVDGAEIPKNIESWTRDKIDKCNWNSTGLNAIFMAIFSEKFN